MVEVFKTNVEEAGHAMTLLEILEKHFPGTKINFDLSDCDRILRLEASELNCERVPDILAHNGYVCCVLEG